MGSVLTTDELRGIVAPLLRAHGLRSAMLFGSYARGSAREDSDIDIVVDGGPSFRPLSVYALGEDLREATGKRVDVFEASELDDGPFRDRVMSEAVPLWPAGAAGGSPGEQEEGTMEEARGKGDVRPDLRDDGERPGTGVHAPMRLSAESFDRFADILGEPPSPGFEALRGGGDEVGPLTDCRAGAAGGPRHQSAARPRQSERAWRSLATTTAGSGSSSTQ